MQKSRKIKGFRRSFRPISHKNAGIPFSDRRLSGPEHYQAITDDPSPEEIEERSELVQQYHDSQVKRFSVWPGE